MTANFQIAGQQLTSEKRYGYGCMVQFDAGVDPVLARMDAVFTHVNPVFSFPWK